MVFAIKLFAYLPLSLTYRLASLVAWVLNSILRYRKDVIEQNMKRSFPKLSPSEISVLRRSYYLYLSEMMVETIRLYRMSAAELKDLIRFENPSVLQQYSQSNKKVIIMMGHSGNWELAGVLTSLEFDMPMYPVYRRIKNTGIDQFYLELRSRFGGIPINEKEITAHLSKVSGPLLVAMLADQSPPKKSGVYTQFLNQPTAFFRGSEVLAKRITDTAIVFAHVRRHGRGDYRIVLQEAPTQLLDKQYGLLQSFAVFLESEINRDKVNWLWSHRRWKHAPAAGSKWMQ